MRTGGPLADPGVVTTRLVAFFVTRPVVHLAVLRGPIGPAAIPPI